MAQNSNHDLLAVAYVLQPHHLHGEVSVLHVVPDLLSFEDLMVGSDLYLRSPGGETRPCSCESLRPHKNRWLVKLSGIDSRNLAEELRGFELCMYRRNLPELPEDWFWEADLEGCRVLDDVLGEIGVVKGLDTSSAQTRLVVADAEERKFRIPWVDAFFPEVRLDDGIIHSSLPEGILEWDG